MHKGHVPDSPPQKTQDQCPNSKELMIFFIYIWELYGNNQYDHEIKNIIFPSPLFVGISFKYPLKSGLLILIQTAAFGTCHLMTPILFCLLCHLFSHHYNHSYLKLSYQDLHRRTNLCFYQLCLFHCCQLSHPNISLIEQKYK